jgi:hypothetical protein
VKILEIARTGYFRGLFPGDVTRFDLTTYENLSSDGVRGLAPLARAIKHGGFDLIVCEPNYRSPWHPATLGRTLFSRRALQGRISLTRPFGAQLMRLRGLPPIAVVDIEDNATVNRCDRYLLDACLLYFKRELPVDGWRLFANTLTPKLPSPRFRAKPENLARFTKLRPISLGIPPQVDAMMPIAPREKTADLFFSGTAHGLPARQRAFAELDELRAAGVVVDVPEHRLEPAEFYARCAAARMVLSPQGYGWDCFRHYESAACGSVPVMNYPQILQHQPMQDGVNCFYYPPEPGGLAATVKRALEDKDRLVVMAEKAREHVTRHHRREALGHYVIDSCLGANGSGGTTS